MLGEVFLCHARIIRPERFAANSRLSAAAASSGRAWSATAAAIAASSPTAVPSWSIGTPVTPATSAPTATAGTTASATAMLPEFTSDFSDFPLGVRKIFTIGLCLFYFIGRPGLGQFFLEIIESIGANRTPLSTQNHEPHRPVEIGDLSLGECARDFLRQSQSRHPLTRSISLFDVVVDLHFTVAYGRVTREVGNSLAYVARNERVPVNRESRRFEVRE
jgi:hypothetical protein